MATAYNPSVVTSGLVLCLDAGNSRSYPGSGTAWTDLSGRGNNGTLTNGPTYSSTNGGSILFDGTNDFATFANISAYNTNSVSVIVWAKAEDLNRGTYKTLLAKNNSPYTGTNRDWNIYVNAGGEFDNVGPLVGPPTHLHFSSSDAVGYWWQPITTIKGNWYQFGFFANGSGGSGTIFNGNKTSVQTLPLNLPQLNAPITIGAADSGDYFNSNISAVYVYNRELTTAEIQQNFNALRGRYGI